MVEDMEHCSMSIWCVGKNLYTNSGKYEFIINFSINGVSSEKAGIYNEDGDLLFALPCGKWDAGYTYTVPFIKDGKLFIQVKDTLGYDESRPNTTIVTKCYQLAGSQASGENTLQSRQGKGRLYPNPARHSVTLEYDIQGQMQQMQITDMQGRVVENYLLDPGRTQIKINTSDYKKGTYIYRYGNTSGKFIVQ